MIRTERDVTAGIGDTVKLLFPVLAADAILPATIVGIDGNVVRGGSSTRLTLQ